MDNLRKEICPAARLELGKYVCKITKEMCMPTGTVYIWPTLKIDDWSPGRDWCPKNTTITRDVLEKKYGYKSEATATQV